MSINGISQLVKTSSLASTVHTPLLMHRKELFKGGSKSGDEQIKLYIICLTFDLRLISCQMMQVTAVSIQSEQRSADV